MSRAGASEWDGRPAGGRTWPYFFGFSSFGGKFFSMSVTPFSIRAWRSAPLSRPLISAAATPRQITIFSSVDVTSTTIEPWSITLSELVDCTKSGSPHAGTAPMN